MQAIRAGIFVFPALLLTGCAALLPVVEDPARFYVLEAAEYLPTTDVDTVEVVLGMARVRIPHYLEERGIAVREEGTRIVYSQRHRWAEPLENGLTRLITENLLAEPVVARVVPLPAQRPLPNYDLHVSVSRAEGVHIPGMEPRAIFRGRWELRAGVDARVVASGQVRADQLPWNGQNFDQLAESLSLGVGQLTREIAEAIAGLR